MSRAEPERELVRRALPFFPLAGVLAFAIGGLTSGLDAGLSATIAIVIVTANFLANGLSLAWAAGISSVAVYAVGLGGFFVRMVVFAAAMLALTTMHWFSAVAFVAAFVPATLLLLAFEMRVLSGRRLQADLWYFREGAV